MKFLVSSALLSSLEHGAIVLLIFVLTQVPAITPGLGVYGPAIGALAALVLKWLQTKATKVVAKVNNSTP